MSKTCFQHGLHNPSRRDTRRTTRHLESEKGGGSGDTSLERVRAAARSRSEQTANSVSNL
jgi:hypothetical protein